MTTNTESMNSTNTETPEEKAARIKKIRQETLANARDIKKKLAQEGNTKVVPTSFWNEVFLTFMRNREVKGTQDIPNCITMTDATIEILKERGKI